jgi:hypothetical protein
MNMGGNSKSVSINAGNRTINVKEIVDDPKPTALNGRWKKL